MRGFWVLTIAVSLATVPIGFVRANEPAASTAQERVTVWSGVSYQELEIGTGDTVRPGQVLTFHATGWLSDGTQFWSSRDDGGSPFSLQLRGGKGGVINGWVDGIPGMKVGGRQKLWIPAELAYGKEGFASSIPPDSDLVYEIEVFAIIKPKKKGP